MFTFIFSLIGDLVNNLNTWGKDYWGFLLVMFAISWFGNNLVNNIRRQMFWARRNNALNRLRRSQGNGHISRLSNLSNFRRKPLKEQMHLTDYATDKLGWGQKASMNSMNEEEQEE